MSVSPTELLRPGLLDGRALVLACAAETPSAVADEVEAGCSALGASCARLSLTPAAGAEEQEAEAEQAAAAALASLGNVDSLVVDAGAFFGDGGAERLLACTQAAWSATRALTNAAFISRERPGRVIYVAPPPQPQPGGHAEAARAGLENLARTLSIEWARYAITTVALAPASDTSPRALASMCAFLLSPAGEYFSGCMLDLRGPG